jgi:hypothetical protein
MKSSEIKPIHKFNGGIGATLCHECRVIIHNGFTDDLYCEKHGGKPKFAYKIVRSKDGLIKYGNILQWIEWNEDGTFKKSHDEIGIGRSLVIDFVLGNFKWITTKVSTFKKESDNITFDTKNSTYTIYKIHDELTKEEE